MQLLRNVDASGRLFPLAGNRVVGPSMYLSITNIDMRITILYFLLLACMVTTTAAQSLAVFNIDTSGFPLMKASLFALDANGQRAQPSVSEITVSEDGVIGNVLSVMCPSVPPKDLSSVLVVDVSGSMTLGWPGIERIDLAKAAANAWVQELPLGQSECAITSFDDGNYLNQDFTTDRAKLLDAISRLRPRAGTDYDEGLIRLPAGGLQVSRQGKYQKVIVFLTDGLGRTPQVNAIINEAHKQNCIIYAATLGMACPQSLKDITTQTGGWWFENVTTMAQAEQVYKQILSLAQGTSLCDITWQGHVECDSSRRDVTFGWNGQTVQAHYHVPANTVGELRFNPQSLYCQSKLVGQRFDTVVTVTAINLPFTVTGITSTDPAYDVNPKSFTLAVGESQTLTVSYTPSDSGFTWTRFDVQSDQCVQSFYASGGYPGFAPVRPTLKLIQPNGGEVFVAGSETLVAWNGIPIGDTVTLEYSSDNGNSWRTITDEAVGGKYLWNVPTISSPQCLVCVKQHEYADAGHPLGWAKAAGGSSSDFANGMAIDGVGNIYIAGAFVGRSWFGATKLSDAGMYDAFVAKYHPNGQAEWAHRAGGTQHDYGTDVAVDVAGNIYVTGFLSDGADFDGVTLTTNGAYDLFVAKYHQDGNLEWAKRAGGTDYEYANAIAVDASGNAYVTGSFQGVSDFAGATLTSAGGKDIFIAKFRSDGSIEWAKRAGGIGGDEGYGIAADASGNIYVTGKFSVAMDFDGAPVSGVNGDDIFIAKLHIDGSVEWVKSAGGDDADEGDDITVDPAGNIYLTGEFQKTASFDGTLLMSFGEQDMFLAKYNSDGSFQWVRRAGGDMDDYGYAVSADPSGNVYVTGYFSNVANFGGIKITTAGGGDIFVAKYNRTGNIGWVRRAGGTINVEDVGNDIVVDASGSVYATGNYRGAADFGADTLIGLGGTDIFLWKMTDRSLQIDSSDAVFSIVMPQPLSRDVDMGQVPVGSTKDSVVQAFVNNIGTYPFGVREIQIVGTGASQFSLVSGTPPFDVPAGSSYPVEFRFEPTSVGITIATLRIITQTDTLLQSIRGEGVAPPLVIVDNLVDFGQVSIGNQKDSMHVLTVANIGSTQVAVTGTRQDGPNDRDFITLAGGGAFTLQPGDTARLDLRFAPSDTGGTSGRLLFDYNGLGSPATVRLFGVGTEAVAVQASMSVPSIAAKPGEEVELPIILSESTNLAQSSATKLTATLRFNASLLAPIGDTPLGTLIDSERVIPLELPMTPHNGNVLATLHLRASLGNDTMTALTIENMGAVGGRVEVRAESGRFHLLGVCNEGGARLLNPNAHVGILKITPNPMNGSAEVEVETLESGRTRLVLSDMLGQEIETIFDGEIAPGQHRLTLSADRLSIGMYYVLLTTPTVRQVRLVNVIQ